MSTSFCWELFCERLVSHPGGVKDSHLLNTTETGDKRRLHGPLGSLRIQLGFLIFVLYNLHNLIRLTLQISAGSMGHLARKGFSQVFLSSYCTICTLIRLTLQKPEISTGSIGQGSLRVQLFSYIYSTMHFLISIQVALTMTRIKLFKPEVKTRASRTRRHPLLRFQKYWFDSLGKKMIVISSRPCDHLPTVVKTFSALAFVQKSITLTSAPQFNYVIVRAFPNKPATATAPLATSRFIPGCFYLM